MIRLEARETLRRTAVEQLTPLVGASGVEPEVENSELMDGDPRGRPTVGNHGTVCVSRFSRKASPAEISGGRGATAGSPRRDRPSAAAHRRRAASRPEAKERSSEPRVSHRHRVGRIAHPRSGRRPGRLVRRGACARGPAPRPIASQVSSALRRSGRPSPPAPLGGGLVRSPPPAYCARSAPQLRLVCAKSSTRRCRDRPLRAGSGHCPAPDCALVEARRPCWS